MTTPQETQKPIPGDPSRDSCGCTTPRGVSAPLDSRINPVRPTRVPLGK